MQHTKKMKITCLSHLDGRAGQKEIPINYIDYQKEQILDSGCSHHVTGNSQGFSEMRHYNGDKVIVTADNTTHPMVKEGTVKIIVGNNEVQLSDVYHVPSLKKNLISVYEEQI